MVRLYGLRNWVEQGYKQLKRELGWADFQVRADRAIRRHWALVGCAFAFCWRAWFTSLDATWPVRPPGRPHPGGAPGPGGRGGKGAGGRGAGPRPGRRAAPRPPGVALLAGRPAPRAELAGALDRLWRIWRAWHSATPPQELQWLLALVGDGHSLHLYLRL